MMVFFGEVFPLLRCAHGSWHIVLDDGSMGKNGIIYPHESSSHVGKYTIYIYPFFPWIRHVFFLPLTCESMESDHLERLSCKSFVMRISIMLGWLGSSKPTGHATAFIAGLVLSSATIGCAVCVSGLKIGWFWSNELLMGLIWWLVGRHISTCYLRMFEIYWWDNWCHE